MFRGYDAAVGRFMQVDPLATSTHNMSAYQYANNNPVLFNDPLGLRANYPVIYTNPWNPINGNENYHWSDQYSSNGSGGYSITFNFDQLADGVHLFNFSNGQPSSYTYYSDADIARMGISTLGWIVGTSYNPNSDYSGGPRLWGDTAGTLFDPTGKGTHIAGKKGGGENIFKALVRTGGILLDATQLSLDVIGLVPGVGEIADGTNAGIYALRGDYVNAGFSAAAMVPFLGWGATGTKLANRAHTVYTGVKNGKQYLG